MKRFQKDALHALNYFTGYLKKTLGRNLAHEQLADEYGKAACVGFALLHSTDPAHQALAAQFASEHDSWIARTSYELLNNKRAGILALVRATTDEADSE